MTQRKGLDGDRYLKRPSGKSFDTLLGGLAIVQKQQVNNEEMATQTITSREEALKAYSKFLILLSYAAAVEEIITKGPRRIIERPSFLSN